MDANWELKKQMAEGISNSRIDDWYKTAKRNGATGGKFWGQAEADFCWCMHPGNTMTGLPRYCRIWFEPSLHLKRKEARLFISERNEI